MPLAHLHLLHISKNLPLAAALKTLLATNPAPLTVSIPIRWMITPNNLPNGDASTLLRIPWSVLYISTSSDLPQSIKDNLLDRYHLTVGIPSRLLENFASKNDALLHPQRSGVPSLTGSLKSPRFGTTSQTIELTPDLLTYIDSLGNDPNSWRTGAISMLNFLAFKPGEAAKQSYLRYGKAFAETIGDKRGGTAKLVGHVVYDSDSSQGRTPTPAQAKQEAKEWSGTTTQSPTFSSAQGGDVQEQKWTEFALAHYPSLSHFADMVGSKDYQEVNLRDRVPALANTCILFTSELLVQEILAAEGGKSKL